ncbi:DUF1672 family protein [Staphylococcus pettenkoferi]|uniref:DUF1672 family protein n=1 Tax=Staphylococcus pettenkoferi TaxID=170573 RepID=UPI001431CB22|nr:DUF1672 family protein [Staphylococcus pettenkoferi]MCY1620904.1 DUF1672 domain-containing protein [Staphylococcus pettenkoferi]
MKKQLLIALLISSIFLNGCEKKKQENSVPNFMPAQKYKGQGFGEDGDKELKELIKKHRKEYEHRGEQFYRDNFHLNVKATNVIAEHDVITVFVHCNDRDICFNASISLGKNSYKEHSSMRSYDDGDAMSDIVSPVIAGFEYRFQKEKYDNLYHFLDKNKNKYQYTGYTKEAVLKTRSIGYQNEYFYIPGHPITISQYNQYFEPLLNLDKKSYKEQFKQSKKAIHNLAKNDLITTLYSTRKNYTRKNNHSTALKMVNELESKKSSLPKNTDISLEFHSNKLQPKSPKWGNQYTTSYDIQTD